MASLWNALRQEVVGTVDDFRQKGALGALKDAALDTRDMAAGAGSWLFKEVQSFVDSDEHKAVVRFAGVPARGATVPLEFSDGRVVEATVLDIDGVSQPPRARITADGLDEPLLVNVLAPGEAMPTSGETNTGILGSLKQDLKDTVQDFREKGAVATFKDAALDAADLVGTTANKAATGARSLAERASLIDVNQAPEGSGDASQPPASGDETAQQQGGLTAGVTSLVDGIKQEFNDTVQDFREKGAVATLKDAALDAADLVGNTANKAASGARSLAERASLIDLTQSAEGSGDASQPPASGDETAQQQGGLTAGVTSLVDGIKQEFNDTVQDFREKGAVATLKDAALDAADLVGSTANKAASGARSLAERASLIDVNQSAEGSGDASQPPASGDETAQQQGGLTAGVTSLVDGIKQEFNDTVQDFREKGAVATFKDAALDAVDIVSSTATTAASSARSVAAPLLEDLWVSQQGKDSEETSAVSAAAEVAATAAPSSSSSAPAPAEAPAPSVSSSSAAGESAAKPEVKESLKPSPSTPTAGRGGGYVAAPPPKVAAPSSPDAGNSQMPEKPGRKSLVSMRRSMFEKPKEEEPKAADEEEEVID